MSIDEEFRTVDDILASKAPTLAVDAFALSLIKAERQARKLFTHLVYQFPAFGNKDVKALRGALEARRDVYFRGVLAGLDALSPTSVEALVGKEYRHLKGRLDKAGLHRNKIFHGQLTADELSRADLLTFVADIRRWCSLLAEGALAEFKYDGFKRNSFQKAQNANLALGFRVQFLNLGEYEAFIRTHMLS